MKIGLLGSSGFVGSAVKQALDQAGHETICIAAPRLTSTSRTVDETCAEAATADLPTGLRLLDECDAVINAAGAASPGGAATDDLFGANGLLPALLARSMATTPGRRLVHISSAAVHGAQRRLDELAPPRPVTPYGASKLVGERAATRTGDDAVTVVVYRPTSVHGPDRPLTQSLARFARSQLSSVASPGTQPTPQVLVDNVAATAVFLATCDAAPTAPVLHPWETMTTGVLLTGLSGGRPPRRVPRLIARSLVAAALTLGRLHPSVKAQARRLEMLWFGQEQAPGWLLEHGPAPVRTWSDAFPELAAGSNGAQQ